MAILGGEDSGLELVEVAHRFDGHEVRASRRAEAHLLGEGVVGGVELEVAGGLEEPSGGTDVERHEAPSAGARGGLLGDGDRGGYHVGERRVAVVLGGVGAEGVGVDDVRPGGEIVLVDGAHVVRPREVPELGHLARLQSPRLELRSHRPVEEQYAVLAENIVVHCAYVPFLTPMTALTDLEGTIRSESVSETPTLRGASRSASSSRWAASGKSA